VISIGAGAGGNRALKRALWMLCVRRPAQPGGEPPVTAQGYNLRSHKPFAIWQSAANLQQIPALVVMSRSYSGGFRVDATPSHPRSFTNELSVTNVFIL
jgi:hypothetical protein